MNQESSSEKRVGNEKATRRDNRKLQSTVEGFHEMLATNNIRFSCECDQDNCNAIIEMANHTYTSLHKSPNRFTIKPGHERLDIEKIVDRYYGFLVIEKPQL
jgi:hypothetical protein